MPLHLDWSETVLRLALATLAGGILGLNRTERGVAAGLRTTLLVCLTAAALMIQANLLLESTGKAENSFAAMDVLRLPLGILTGMGFIGAGAILRRGDQVAGVTTAATLWFTTAVGLALGGGQYGLGLCALLLGAAILWLLKDLENRITQERTASLWFTIDKAGPADGEIQSAIRSEGYVVHSWNASYMRTPESALRTVRCRVEWKSRPLQEGTPEFVKALFERPGVHSVRWHE